MFLFISGFCSLLYELIWLRLAMADLGVTTAMVSTVLSGDRSPLPACRVSDTHALARATTVRRP